MAVKQSGFLFSGGLNQKEAAASSDPGGLLVAKNVEPVITGGYARALGYTKYDTNVVPGEGNILGVWVYGGKVYAFRNAVGGASAVMWESEGNGWTSKKTGLAPDGKYNFVNGTFYGSVNMYGASGTHKAFQWDGTTWTDITTGVTVDEPDIIGYHKNYIWLGFGTSLQFSPIGDPVGVWTPLTGAGEIQMQSAITAIKSLVGGRLGVFARNSISYLDGSSSQDFVAQNMTEHGNNSGAIGGSVQQLGQRVIIYDDRGISEVLASDRFGDFADAALSMRFTSIVNAKRDQITCSCVVRNKTQYRVFFSDGQALILGFAGESFLGGTLLQFDVPVLCVCSEEDDSGKEIILFGSNDGYVYKMEEGNSFDGGPIEAYIRTNFWDYKTPVLTKRFRRAYLDLSGSSGATDLQCKADAVFADSTTIGQALSLDVETTLFGGILGHDVLGEFILSSQYISNGVADLNTHGTHMSLILHSSSINSNPWQIANVAVSYSERKLRRGR